ncbi:PTS sugar transporter subunit IIA [Arcanobacterium ihumii]|uniref:PTS sugar transporter subunit IIA n=1 Tax=Arcanobacterium ihumii TaxID=2138162 RepID=UPI00190F4630|nr:PTS glucose transporter subunit IIA [Arcanobacterium ihumii]
MGLFDWMKKTAEVKVFAPVPGNLLELAEVPDPVFAGEILGKGFAVAPTGCVFASPIAGEITMLAPTLHAFGVRSPEGAEILVHIGIDTVALKGEGFEALAQVGDAVKAGDPVVCVAEDVAGKVPSMISPVVNTSKAKFEIAELNLAAKPGEPVAILHALEA